MEEDATGPAALTVFGESPTALVKLRQRSCAALALRQATQEFPQASTVEKVPSATIHGLWSFGGALPLFRFDVFR